MQQPEQMPQREADRVPRGGGGDAFMSLLSAAAFAYFGFMVGLRGISDSRVYNLSVDAFTLMSKGLAIGLFLVSLANFSGYRPGFLLDAVLSVVAALASFAIGAIWLAFGDQQGILLIILGGICSSAAWSSYDAWRGR